MACDLVEAPTATGKVIRIADGDSFEMRNHTTGKTERVRMFGIDAPERGQAFANKARTHATQLLQGQDIDLEILSEDRFGRLVGLVYLQDGRCVNFLMVEAGYAWWFQRYAPGHREFARLEAQARERGLGLWRDKHPQPPWEFRQDKRR